MSLYFTLCTLKMCCFTANHSVFSPFILTQFMCTLVKTTRNVDKLFVVFLAIVSYTPMTLFENWVVEVSFFGLRLIYMCVMPCISFTPPQTVIACAKYICDHRAEIVQMHFTFSTNIGHLVTSDWNIYSFCCGIPLFICASTHIIRKRKEMVIAQNVAILQSDSVCCPSNMHMKMSLSWLFS